MKREEFSIRETDDFMKEVSAIESDNKYPLPPAEGAEEMLWSGAEKIAEKYDITDRIDDDPETGELQFIPSPSFIEAVHDLGVRFATLHAQRIAEKMAEERLKKEYERGIEDGKIIGKHGSVSYIE